MSMPRKHIRIANRVSTSKKEMLNKKTFKDNVEEKFTRCDIVKICQKLLKLRKQFNEMLSLYAVAFRVNSALYKQLNLLHYFSLSIGIFSESEMIIFLQVICI